MWHSLQSVLLRLQPLPRSANPHRTGTANGASLDVASLDFLPRAPGPSLRTWVFSVLYAFSGCSRRALPLLPYLHHNPVHKHLIHHRHMPQRPEERRVIPHLPPHPFFIHRRKQRRQCHSHICEPPLPQNLLHGSGSSPHSGTTIYPADASPEACTHRFVPAGFPLPRESASCVQTTRSATASSTQSLRDANRPDSSKEEKPPVAAPAPPQHPHALVKTLIHLMHVLEHVA